MVVVVDDCGIRRWTWKRWSRSGGLGQLGEMTGCRTEVKGSWLGRNERRQSVQHRMEVGSGARWSSFVRQVAVSHGRACKRSVSGGAYCCGKYRLEWHPYVQLRPGLINDEAQPGARLTRRARLFNPPPLFGPSPTRTLSLPLSKPPPPPQPFINALPLAVSVLACVLVAGSLRTAAKNGTVGSSSGMPCSLATVAHRHTGTPPLAGCEPRCFVSVQPVPPCSHSAHPIWHLHLHVSVSASIRPTVAPYKSRVAVPPRDPVLTGQTHQIGSWLSETAPVCSTRCVTGLLHSKIQPSSTPGHGQQIRPP